MFNKKQTFKTIVSIGVLIIGLLLFILIKDMTGNDSVRTLEMLQTYLVGGRIYDADGSIGVSDVYDVHYRWDGDDITIYFGNNVMTFSGEELKDNNILGMLNNINLEIEGKTLYYEGQEVPE